MALVPVFGNTVAVLGAADGVPVPCNMYSGLVVVGAVRGDLLIKKYSALGVELFDGIHWQDSLFNPSKTDFTDLSRLMDIDCSCQYCNKLRDIRKINKKEFENLYMYYTLSHNLFHFKVLMKNIRSGQI